MLTAACTACSLTPATGSAARPSSHPSDARRARSGDNGATLPDLGAAITLRQPRRTHRKAAEVQHRLDGLTGDFARYVAVYHAQVPFAAADQYDSHRLTIDRRRALSSVTAALGDDDFIAKLYRTLGRWGIGVRGSNLVPRDEFAAVLRPGAVSSKRSTR